jgi:hypothetical protein
MPNVVFFSFTEADRAVVQTIKDQAENPKYSKINFPVKDLLKRRLTDDTAVMRAAITKVMDGTSRTIVLVGNKTHLSMWVEEEVKMTIENGNPLYAIRLKDTHGKKPKILDDNGIYLYPWNEERLQDLATR